MSKGSDYLSRRIEEAPLTTREELIEAVFGEDSRRAEAEVLAAMPTWKRFFTRISNSMFGPYDRAEEWIDLADAGPFVDETTVPLYQDGERVIWGSQQNPSSRINTE
jgi:hypothetical protein